MDEFVFEKALSDILCSHLTTELLLNVHIEDTKSLYVFAINTALSNVQRFCIGIMIIILP